MSTVCVTRTPERSIHQDASQLPEHKQASRSVPIPESRLTKALRRILTDCWTGAMKVLAAQRPAKKILSVCESVSLGDKRFVAVVQVGHERFLIGGATNSIAMLTRLAEPEPDFSKAMKECSEMAQERPRSEIQ